MPFPWLAAAGVAADAFGSILGHSSASAANAANIKLAREQRAWETQMSNTAVQRRVRDITLAGGNPALAFTEGASASTPSVQAPTVEPTFRPEWTKGSVGQAMLAQKQVQMQQAQTDNAIADTQKKVAETRGQNIANNIAELYGPMNAENKLTLERANIQQVNAALDKLDIEMRNATLTGAMTAAQLEQYNKTKDQLAEMIRQQVRTGQIDLQALENVAKIGGTEAGKGAGVLKTLIDLIRLVKDKD